MSGLRAVVIVAVIKSILVVVVVVVVVRVGGPRPYGQIKVLFRVFGTRVLGSSV